MLAGVLASAWPCPTNPTPARCRAANPRTIAYRHVGRLAFGIGIYSHLCLGGQPKGRRMSDALTATRSVLAREQRLSALDGLAAAAAHSWAPGHTVLVSAELTGRDDLPEGLREDLALMRERSCAAVIFWPNW